MMSEWLDINHWQHIGIGVLMEISNWTVWSAAVVETGFHAIFG